MLRTFSLAIALAAALAPAAAFATPVEVGTPRLSDILRVTNLVKSETERGSKVRLELRAQNAGTCTISFHRGKDSATATVVVEPERP
jgi:hypothetical protein